jgi:hypothetical protein
MLINTNLSSYLSCQMNDMSILHVAVPQFKVDLVNLTYFSIGLEE